MASASTEWTLKNIDMYLILGPRDIGNGKWVMETGLGNIWIMHDGTGPGAKVVGRAQGVHRSQPCDQMTLIFDNGSFSGSTLEVSGTRSTKWTIDGGTGQFAKATGDVSTKEYKLNGDNYATHLAIRAFCPRLNKGKRIVFSWE